MTTVTSIFTITRETRNGILEYLTNNGFRSEDTHTMDDRLYFTREEGSLKVKELRKQCRIPSIARSIILNY